MSGHILGEYLYEATTTSFQTLANPSNTNHPPLDALSFATTTVPQNWLQTTNTAVLYHNPFLPVLKELLEEN